MNAFTSVATPVLYAPPDPLVPSEVIASTWQAHVTDGDFVASLVLAAARDGRLHVMSFRVDRESMTSFPPSYLKALPFGAIVAAARSAVLEAADGIQAEGIDLRPDLRQSQRGRRISREQLQAAADAYTSAWRRHEPVTAAVADACGVSISTAGKRIMAARQAGLLDGIGSERR